MQKTFHVSPKEIGTLLALVNSGLLDQFGVKGISFRGADMRGAELVGSILTGIDLESADLTSANLQETNLCEARLHGAILRDAVLVAADLSNADLSNTNLRGADLQNATLAGVNLLGATYDSSTKWPTKFDPHSSGAVYQEQLIRSIKARGRNKWDQIRSYLGNSDNTSVEWGIFSFAILASTITLIILFRIQLDQRSTMEGEANSPSITLATNTPAPSAVAIGMSSPTPGIGTSVLVETPGTEGVAVETLKPSPTAETSALTMPTPSASTTSVTTAPTRPGAIAAAATTEAAAAATPAASTAVTSTTSVTGAAPVRGSGATTITTSTSSSPSRSVNLVAALEAEGGFDTLVEALQAANLTAALEGAGPFTIFAPTDAAFAGLPAGAVDQLLANPTGQLTQILLFHMLPGTVMAEDIENGMQATTLQGKSVVFEVAGNTIKVNGATVTAPDIMANNGVVHAIDTVILPPPDEPLQTEP